VFAWQINLLICVALLCLQGEYILKLPYFSHLNPRTYSEWDCRAPVVDLMCGAGTIPIEAALLAAKIPPGSHQSFLTSTFHHLSPQYLLYSD
jgi:23S rRNA G2445 N2-methylase RlmL